MVSAISLINTLNRTVPPGSLVNQVGIVHGESSTTVLTVQSVSRDAFVHKLFIKFRQAARLRHSTNKIFKKINIIKFYSYILLYDN